MRVLWLELIVGWILWVATKRSPDRGRIGVGKEAKDQLGWLSEDTAEAREPAWCHLLSSGRSESSRLEGLAGWFWVGFISSVSVFLEECDTVWAPYGGGSPEDDDDG